MFTLLPPLLIVCRFGRFSSLLAASDSVLCAHGRLHFDTIKEVKLMSLDAFIDFNDHVQDEKPMWIDSDRPPRFSVTTIGLPPGKYVIDVVKEEDGSVLIGFVTEDGSSRLFRRVD